MKKLIAIPLLILYLTAVSGMMVQIHFCGSQVSEWSVNKQKASCCCDSGTQKEDADQKETNLAAKDDDCCSDKTITLKIGQDQNKVSSVQLQLSALQVSILPAFAFPQFVSVVATATPPAYRANAPPGLWQSIPLYKLHSRFTYYG